MNSLNKATDLRLAQLNHALMLLRKNNSRTDYLLMSDAQRHYMQAMLDGKKIQEYHDDENTNEWDSFFNQYDSVRNPTVRAS